jgi:hypothetical protein
MMEALIVILLYSGPTAKQRSEKRRDIMPRHLLGGSRPARARVSIDREGQTRTAAAAAIRKT